MSLNVNNSADFQRQSFTEEESKLELASFSLEERSKFVPTKTTLKQIPQAVLSQILEFAFSTKTHLSTVSTEWKVLTEHPRFWNLAIQEFEMFEIDPSRPSKEVFMERLEQDVKIYEELFSEIPKNLSPSGKYRYCKNSAEFKKIIALKLSENYKKYSLNLAYAILDLNLPIPIVILSKLGMYPNAIQKEFLKRIALSIAQGYTEKKLRKKTTTDVTNINTVSEI